MASTVAVQDLKVGMYIHLELGWMSHPFPLSSFRISSADQIATIRRLGLARVTWVPEKSLDVGASPPAEPAVAPRRGNDESPAVAERRQRLTEQREATRLVERQYGEASRALAEIQGLVNSAPEAAARQTRALARAMLDKMVASDEVCIRVLGTAVGDRASCHALNVTVIALLMGRALGRPEEELQDIGVGALLHDIGKLDLPARVHYPQDDMSPAELKAYRDHVTLGLARARRMGLSEAVQQVLAQHHELADGSGFPARLGVDAMSPAARIVALVNRYDNHCNPGPRGISLTPHEALSTLFAQSRSKFDLSILNGFIRMMGVYPAGSVVQLTDDRYALVAQVNSSRPLKPRVLVHDPKVPRDEALLLDLEREGDLGIRRSLSAAKLPPEAAIYLAPRPRVNYYFDAVSAQAEQPVPQGSAA